MIILGPLATILVALLVVEFCPRRREPDLTAEQLEAAREVEALTPGTPAWQRLDAPAWLRREGERIAEAEDALADLDEKILRTMASLSVPMVVIPKNPADAGKAAVLQRLIETPEFRQKAEAEAYNQLKYGPDAKRWPS